MGRLGRTPAGTATLRSRTKASHFCANSRWRGQNPAFRIVGSNPTLSARGVPFVYSTGNTGQSSRDGYSNRPVLKKPFKYDELAAILAGLKLAPIEQ